MTFPTPLFPPLFAPSRWWQAWLKAALDPFRKAARGLQDGDADAETVIEANRLCPLPSRDWLRIRLEDDSLLSLPVAGGASALKNHDPPSWRWARESRREYGKIRRSVLTLFGNRPFCHLLAPVLFPENDEDLAEGLPVAPACRKRFEAVREILGLDNPATLESLAELKESGRSALLAADLDPEFNPSSSIIEPLFSFGPDTIFLI